MKYLKQDLKKFRAGLMLWNRLKNDRKMPWKGEKDPYKIWLSEIILQQTRVDQGLVYYQKFIKAFPEINSLAATSEKKVYKLWEGLGYYTRCKNLIETARFISTQRKGRFPETFEDLLALKGVGLYTASAIASFAYKLPYAVVDGNVFRVLSRYFGIKTPIDSTQGKKLYSALADVLLDKKNPGVYNQAIMDFGAVVCKPHLPNCKECGLAKNCFAFKNDLTKKLPVKENKKKLKRRWLTYFILQIADKIYLNKRVTNDIWKNLYEFALIESEKKQPIKAVIKEAEKNFLLPEKVFKVDSVSKPVIQLLTHQKIEIQFIKITLNRYITIKGLKAISIKALGRYPFPKTLREYLKNAALPSG